MTNMFWVDTAALASAGQYLDSVADEIGSLRPDRALAGSAEALAGTRTASAVEQLALRVTTCVAAYAAATSAIGSRAMATAEDYNAVDDSVEASMRRLAQ